MKIWLVLLYAAGMTISVDAQDITDAQVPSVVRNAFQQKYANAEKVKWETKGDLFKAEFKIGSRGHDVWIDKTGKITKQKEDFPKKNLPKAILQKLSAEFSAYKLDDADKIEENGKIYYEIELDGSSDDREVLFTSDGQVLENKID